MALPDYYAILGVLPSAEDVVIKAAYRALAQRYHPDKAKGRKASANARMKEINAAYEVLSDKAKRAAYDSECGTGATVSDEAFREVDEDAPPSFDPLEELWNVALEYHPALDEYERRLAKTSWRLAFAYKAILLTSQAYGDGESIASKMEYEFLCRYFGENEGVLSLARDLIRDGHRAAARELNKVVVVVGASVTHDVVLLALKKKRLVPADYLTSVESERRQIKQANEEANRVDDTVMKWGLGVLVVVIAVIVIVSARSH